MGVDGLSLGGGSGEKEILKYVLHAEHKENLMRIEIKKTKISI